MTTELPDTQSSAHATVPVALKSNLVLGPLAATAWAIFVDSGNARMWSTLQPHVQKLADAEGLDVTPLYALTPDDVAAVNAARKERAWKVARRLGLCRCDHIEYCRHCYPVEFRPGGVWGGPNV